MRSYERPLVALMAILGVLLLLAILQPRLLLIEASETSVADRTSHQAAADPVANPGKHRRATEDSKGDITLPPVPSEGPPYDRPAANKDRPPDQLLCSAPERLSTINTNGLAVAADPDGHYTLYALPEAETGLPSRNSYELLRGCLPKRIFANTTDIKTAGSDEAGSGQRDPASGESATKTGASNVKHPTRRITSDTGSQLVTTYEVDDKLNLTQRLELQAGKLKIVYGLENKSDEPTSVTLRSLLSPTPASPGQDVLFELPNAGTKDGVRRDTVVSNEVASRTNNVWAPRPAAASDSTAVWRPAVGPQPSKIVFAGFHRLNSGPFDYDASDRYPLPPNASMAIYWKGLSIGPGETVTVGQTYGPKADRGASR